MRPHHAVPVVILVLLLVMLPDAASMAAPYQYVEDFTAKTYCDTLHTTALWDTTLGELRLPPLRVSLTGSTATYSNATNVCIDGDYAYVTDYSSGLTVVDITDPADPVVAGNCDTPGYSSGVAVMGDYAYVVDGTAGLRVLDITDPTSPTSLGYCFTGGYAVDVALSGDYAYVADQDYGLVVVDVATAASPAVVGGYDPGSIGRGIAVDGDHAYLASDTDGLLAIDISDPSNPTPAGSYDTPSAAYDVVIDGDYAYVADWGSGLQVIDISDPTNPAFGGNYDSPNFARGLAVEGDNLYLADSNSGVQVLDISDPANPSRVDGYDTPGSARGMAVDGEHLFVADYASGLLVLRVSLATSPFSSGSCTGWLAGAWGVSTAGDYAYVASTGYGLRVVDVSDPTNPIYAGGCDTPGSARDVSIAGDYAYVADNDYGLRVIDISDPTNPVSAGTCDTPGFAFGVALSGDYAYVADHAAGGLQVIDISDPTTPVVAGSYNTPGNAHDVAVAGDHAYVADGGSGLRVVDISDPTNPVSVGSCATADGAHGVAVAGDYAYVADWGAGLQVVDISDPASPTPAGSHDTPGLASAVDVEGNYACVADDTSGLHVFDISDPTAPVLVGRCNTPGQASGVSIAGDHAYVADYGSDLHVVEIFQRAVDPYANAARSLDIEPDGGTVLCARLCASHTDSFAWELSANGGANWEAVACGGDWLWMAHPGSELLWRSTLTYTGGPVSPACTDLTISWLYGDPVIDLVADIPDDQGRQVRVSWTRSGFDCVETTVPVTEYAVFRRIDDARALAPESERSVLTASWSTLAPLDSEEPILYPPGDWDFIMTVPAYGEDEYSVVVPTLGDSTIVGGMYYSVFFVRAATASPTVYFDARPDSGYSVDNLAPAVPAGFGVDYSANENELTWLESDDEDFQYFRIYRGTDPEFTPGPENLVHMTIETGWIDSVTEGWQYHYKVSAVDFSGNESDPASPETVTCAEELGAPHRYALYQNVPNPLGPATVIRYDVPGGGGAVTLEIFDVSGRLVRRLLDGHQAPGRKSVVWDGRNERGESVGSGVYYYRLEAPGYEKTLRLMVVK